MSKTVSAFLLFGCLLVQTAALGDTCVKFSKRAPVKGVCGDIINPVGEKLNDVEIDLIDEAGSVIFSAKSDKNGRFSFRSIPPGGYTLRAQTRGYQLAQRQIRVVGNTAEKCRRRIEITLGTSLCSTGTFVKGVDKSSDLEK